jgi:hypothetical protein
MVAWMHEILGIVFAEKYQSGPRTVLLAVMIMDQFLGEKKYVEPSHDLIHLIGIVAMFIASKFEDVNNIRLKIFQKKISHDRFSKETIVAWERETLTTLGFRLPTITPLDCVGEILQ